MENNLHYTGMALDRADALRREPELIAQLWQSEQSYIVPVCLGKNLFRTDSPVSGQLEVVFARQSEMAAFIACAEYQTFLGREAGKNYFALEIAENDKALLCEQLQAKFIDLRSVGPLLNRHEAAVLAYARAMHIWREQHRFCSRCGAGLQISHGGHVLKCSDAACLRETYPRTDPAVIMLVERTGPGGVEQCLLGRHPAWQPGSFSTLAGFVEPGETLEAAVRREVAEESGVVVGAVRYAASQPWPFPASIMLGFFANALETEIVLDPHELAEAYWFSREELLGFGEWGDDNSEHNLPRRDSIARYLIDQWLYKDGFIKTKA